MKRKKLAKLIAEHEHRYDSDCGLDSGCSCGAQLVRDEEAGWDALEDGRKGYAKHLAAVIHDAELEALR